MVQWLSAGIIEDRVNIKEQFSQCVIDDKMPWKRGVYDVTHAARPQQTCSGSSESVYGSELCFWRATIPVVADSIWHTPLRWDGY
jgi:hypothetical protein